MTKTVYAFSENGLRLTSFKYASENTNNLFDLIIKNKVRVLEFKNSLKINGRRNISNCVNSIKEKRLDNCNYIFPIQLLYGYGAKPNVINKISLISNNITDVISELGGVVLRFSPTIQKRITDVIDDFTNDLVNDSNYLKEIILFYLFKNKKMNKKTFLLEIEKIIEYKYCIVPTEKINLKCVIEDLVNEKYILTDGENYIFPSNIFYDSEFVEDEIPSFRTCLKFDFRDREIIKRRIAGETLQSVSNTFNQSRERIRQKQVRALTLIGKTYEENKYKYVFEKYSFSEDDFTYLFNETSDTFAFLNLVCESGKEKLNFDNLSTDNIFKELKVPNSKIKSYRTSNAGWFDKFIKENTNHQFDANTFTAFYNCTNEDNMSISKGSILGQVTRSKYTIASSNGKFRYFDYDSKEIFLEILSEIINSLKKGAYSVNKLYRLYPALMRGLDIRDVYELHYFIKKNIELFDKKILFPRVKLTRSPGMLVDVDDKDEFVRNEMKKFSGKNVLSFVDYMNKEYGFQKNTFEAYLDVTFKNEIFNRVIINSDAKLNEDNIIKLKKELGEEIYLKDEFEDKVLKYFDKISPELLKEINYSLMGDVYYNIRNASVSDAIKRWINKGGLMDKSYMHVLSQSSTVKRDVDALQKNYEVFQINMDTYCAIDFLNNAGIDKDKITSFVDKVYDFSKKNEFFSIKNVVSNLENDEVVECGFNDIFYDEIIAYSGKFNVIKNNMNRSGRIFTSENYDADNFVNIELKLCGKSMKVDDFMDKLSDKYGIKFNRQFIENHAGYYANKMDKIFLNKDQYFNIWSE